MEVELESLSAPGSRHRVKPTLEDRLIARMLGRWLDREIAAGTAPSASEAHTARACQLTSERTRRGVASSLDRLIERADRPPSRSPLGSAAPCREHVREALPMIRSTSARLRSREPIDAQGVARLKVLLSDLDGPCYVCGRPAALTEALQAISDSLDVGD